MKYDDKGRLRFAEGSGSMALLSGELIRFRNVGKSVDFDLSDSWNISRRLLNTFASNDSIALCEGWADGAVPPPACSACLGVFMWNCTRINYMWITWTLKGWVWWSVFWGLIAIRVCAEMILGPPVFELCSRDSSGWLSPGKSYTPHFTTAEKL